MFDKVKQIYDLRKKAKQMQDELRGINIETESGAVKVAINGEQKIQSVTIDPQKFDPNNLNQLESDIKDALEKAISRSQSIAAEKMKEITGDLGLPGL